MPRAMWTGFLSFGLVNVPVGLYPATADQTVHFNQLHKGTSHRVRYKKVDEETGEELETSDIVNGYPVGGGEYIVVTREEMKAAAPGKSDLIEISDFVDLSRIDPLYFRSTYYLGPRGKGADRAYSLLLAAMRKANKVGIATFVLRDKEHLVAVRPGEDVLMLETMYFDDEIRPATEQLESLPKEVAPDSRELAIAMQLIDSLETEWNPTAYRNTYRERIEKLIEEKREGHAIVFESDQPQSNVLDLMAALEASVAKSAKDRGTARAKTTRPVGKAEQQNFDGMSKAELLARAAEMKVKVQQKMTKLELVKALTEAETPRSRRRSAS